MNNILVIVVLVLAIAVVMITIWQLKRKRKFNNQARTSKEKVDEIIDDGVEDDTSSDLPILDLGIVHEGDEKFEDWETIQDLFHEAGIRNVANNMIELCTDDGTRQFVGIAEIAQSNPFLQSHSEENMDNIFQNVWLDSLTENTKITSQWQRKDMHDFFEKAEQRLADDPDEPAYLKELGRKVINHAREKENDVDRIENHVYVEFLTTVTDREVYGDSPEEIEKMVYQVASENILRKIIKSNDSLRLRSHELTQLNNYEILELIYKTLNRNASKKMRFDKFVKQQKFTLFSSDYMTDKQVKDIHRHLQLEYQLAQRLKHDHQNEELEQQVVAAYQKLINYQNQKRHALQEKLDKKEQRRLNQEVINNK